MEMFVSLLNLYSLMGIIGLIIFLAAYKYSIQIFDWIERQTLGTRTYILEKLEFLFIEVNPDYITYGLLFLSFGNSIIVLGIMILIGKWGLGIFFAIILSFLGWKIPKPFVNYLVAKKIKAYQGQMVDAMTLLSNGIRAGLSMNQAIGMVVDEMPPPISQEFGVILQQNRLGVPLEECLENLAERVPIQDNEMFVSSINILKETGGNLAEVFDTIVDVIRERVRLQQKLDTYVAQGLFQGATVFAMPYIIGGLYAMSDPKAMAPLFTTTIGIIILCVAIGLDLIGGFIILKIVKIKL